ncbi:S-layer homology domain-containing protein [Leucobacter coleopterorum]|uniref:S-layer homology domain-containing protein n=1 Tax=Leucobacter coleopterorum TaxID=2714933 RepID=A0ABX6JZ14_9MICO|nr:S-layer homology domain-containing protein [Leucobacter coleopterorum]
MTREAMAAFMFRMDGTSSYQAPKVSPFADVKPGDKFYREISWMHSQGLSTGTRQTSGKPLFQPKAALSREAMAAFMFRLEKPKAYQAPKVSVFSDMKPSDKFYREVSWMYASKLTTGYKAPNGSRSFGPKQSLTREAMAAFMYRLETTLRLK